MSDRKAEHEHVGGAVRVVGLLTLVSRVAGLARDLVLVRLLGDTAAASSFAAAFAVPNLFRRLFGEGALTAAFIPTYAPLREHDRARAARLAGLALGTIVLVTGALTIGGQALAMALLASIEHDPARDLFFRLVILMLPYMPLVCAAAILGGMLQVRGRFAPAAGAPIILNLTIITAALTTTLGAGATGPEPVSYAVGIGVVVAGVGQVGWALIALRRTREPALAAPISPRDPEARELRRRFVPAALGLGTLQLGSMADMVLAMWPVWVGPTLLGFAYPLTETSNGVLFFSQRLYQFPLGVFGVAIATAAFPALARQANDPQGFAETLGRGVRLALFVAAPAAVGLVLVAGDLTRVLYTGGGSAFSREGADRAALLVAIYGAGVVFYCLNQMLLRAAFALGKTAQAARISAATVGLNVALGASLMWLIGEAALAVGTALSAGAQSFALSRLLKRSGAAPAGLSAPVVARIWTVTLAMALAVAASMWTMGQPETWSASLARLVVCVALGGVVYAGLCTALGADEWRWLVRRRVGDTPDA